MRYILVLFLFFGGISHGIASRQQVLIDRMNHFTTLVEGMGIFQSYWGMFTHFKTGFEYVIVMGDMADRANDLYELIADSTYEDLEDKEIYDYYLEELDQLETELTNLKKDIENYIHSMNN